MTSAYIIKLGLTIQKTSIGASKINGLLLETYGMVLNRFLIQDSLKKVWFFEETFLLTDTSMQVILEILFFSFSNANIKFAELEKLIWKKYTTTKALPTTS